MKQYIFLFLLVSCQLRLAAQDKLTGISLPEALKIAQEKQSTYQNALVEQRITQQGVRQGRSRLLPTVTGALDLRNNLVLQPFVLPGAAAGNPGQDFVLFRQGTNYNGSAGITATIPLYDGNAWATLQSRKLSVESAATATERSRIDLTLNVTRAYYSALLSEAQLQFAEKDVQRNEKLYADIRARRESDRALETDVTRAYLNLSNAKLALQSAIKNVAISKSFLATQIGLDDTALESTQLTSTLVALTGQPAATSWASQKPDAMQRVEYKTEDVQRRLNLAAVKEEQRRYLPTVNLVGYLAALGYANDASFFDLQRRWAGYSYVGLQASIPIFDGLDKSAKIQQNKLRAQKNQQTLTALAQQINYEQHKARLDLDDAFTGLKIQLDNVRLAEENVRVVKLRLAEGRALTQEALDAETSLQQTQTNYLTALYTYLGAKLEWQRVTGGVDGGL